MSPSHLLRADDQITEQGGGSDSTIRFVFAGIGYFAAVALISDGALWLIGMWDVEMVEIVLSLPRYFQAMLVLMLLEYCVCSASISILAHAMATSNRKRAWLASIVLAISISVSWYFQLDFPA